MFVIRSVVKRSINSTLNRSSYKKRINLVTIRPCSTASNKKDTKKTESPNSNVVKKYEEIFEEFSNESQLTLEDKQDKFLDMLFRFRDQNFHYQRLGDCEFILGSLKVLKPLNLHRELEVYKQLMNVFPKEKMKTTNYYQMMLSHYPKHQETAIMILETMGMHNVFPDKEMRIIVRDIFGSMSEAHRKVLSINYWNTKLARKTPFPTPERLITDSFDLAKLALKKMCWDVDVETKIQKYDSSIATMDKENNEWILTAQSNNQKELIKRLNEIVYVEGPFTCFVQYELSVKYFVLTTKKPTLAEFIFKKNELDVSRLKISTFGREKVSDLLERKIKLHYQEDGAILATCITQNSTEQSVIAWIRILSKLNPHLANLQIIFNLDDSLDKAE